MPLRTFPDRLHGEFPCDEDSEWHWNTRRLVGREAGVRRGFLPQHQHATGFDQRFFSPSHAQACVIPGHRRRQRAGRVQEVCVANPVGIRIERRRIAVVVPRKAHATVTCRMFPQVRDPVSVVEPPHGNSWYLAVACAVPISKLEPGTWR